MLSLSLVHTHTHTHTHTQNQKDNVCNMITTNHHFSKPPLMLMWRHKQWGGVPFWWGCVPCARPCCPGPQSPQWCRCWHVCGWPLFQQPSPPSQHNEMTTPTGTRAGNLYNYKSLFFTYAFENQVKVKIKFFALFTLSDSAYMKKTWSAGMYACVCMHVCLCAHVHASASVYIWQTEWKRGGRVYKKDRDMYTQTGMGLGVGGGG